jgi:hypothetical protein
MAVLCVMGGYLPVQIHPVLALCLIPAVARLSLWMRDYSHPPLINYEQNQTQEEPSAARFESVDADPQHPA